MSTPDYTYTFSAIGDQLGKAHQVDHRGGTRLAFEVATADRQLTYWSSSKVLPQVADMVDLAMAVHFADRFSARRPPWTMHIHVTLPVRRPDLLHALAVQEVLRDALYWYTASVWTFTFEQRTATRRIAERQSTFVTSLQDADRTEVALWSGGLDSLAGLWQRQKQHPNIRYVLCGAGPNPIILKRQRDLARHFREVSPALIELVQVPLRLRTLYRTRRNRYQRTRGFVFLLLGAACAHLEGQPALHIYENGIGALNLPFRPAEVGTDHSRAVHPLALLKMGELVSHLLETPFTFNNPFLFQTKAEICAPLVGTAADALIHHTISCDSRPRRRGLPIQCGRCSSCLLRRQALAVNEVRDLTAYAYPRLSDPDNSFALELMLSQRDAIRDCLGAPDAWKALRLRYQDLERTVSRLARSVDVPKAQLMVEILGLYERYVGEWDRVPYLLDSDSSRPWRKAA